MIFFFFFPPSRNVLSLFDYMCGRGEGDVSSTQGAFVSSFRFYRFLGQKAAWPVGHRTQGFVIYLLLEKGHKVTNLRKQ